MIRAAAALALIAAQPAAAEVVKVEPGGFEIASTVTIAAPARQVWAILRTPARWWDARHSYSGDAKNLSLDPRAGGCFCEALPGGGGVEHARVVNLQPARLLRLQGAFGPLQAEAVTGTLTFSLKPMGATTTRVTMRYVVGGYIPGGLQRSRVRSIPCWASNPIV